MFTKWVFQYHYRIRSYCRLTHYPERSWTYGPFSGSWVGMRPNDKGYFTSVKDAQKWFDDGMVSSGGYPKFTYIKGNR